MGKTPERLDHKGNEPAVDQGVRIVTDWNCAPGKHLLVTAPEEGVKSLARVVYCQRVESTKFAVGLQLVVRVEEWGKRGCGK